MPTDPRKALAWLSPWAPKGIREALEEAVTKTEELEARAPVDTTAITSQLAALQGQIDTLTTRATNIEGAATTLTGRVTAAEGAATALTGRVTTLEGLRAGLRTDLDALDTATSDALTDLDARLTALESVTTPPSSTLPTHGISPGFSILQQSASVRNAQLDRMAAIGAQYVRIDSLNNVWQDSLDLVVPAAISRGLKVMLVLNGTTTAITSSQASAFAQAQATKWADEGIVHFEFCNEPDLANRFTPEQYADACVGFYYGLKTGNPNATAIVGALWKFTDAMPSMTAEYVRRMYARWSATGISPTPFDILSIHPYDDPESFDAPENIWHQLDVNTSNVRAIMATNGDAAKKVIGTETGHKVTANEPESTQANVLRNQFEARRAGRVSSIAVFSMMDADVPGFGLLRPDGTERPAYAVYQQEAAL